ncbi:MULTISPECIES: ATP-dependent DNA ligase [Cryobacterium]|uniref:ATP-dependent DNA ligase n=1 Tax=Cryobacterium lyxosi TaxID=1259228 RepID=A0A4V3IP95_9MICO|nr:MULTISPECIES: ATP-dependent DNA ligase [Cryobacterium]TFD26415.1 ATP-dependent DNA ligase [Cryobacterium lyxosi]
MGKLTYDSSLTVDFDDRVLAHIQLVVGAKLRRGESFYFSWRDDPPVGGGRSTVWMHPGISLAYKYFGSKVPVLNRDWVEALSLSANSATGLQLMAEPAQRTPLALRPGG